MIGTINSFVTKVVDSVKAPIYAIGPHIVPEIKFSRTAGKSYRKIVKKTSRRRSR